MAQTPTLCCPKPAFNAQHPHKPAEESNKVPTTPGYACENPLYIISCGDAVEPPPVEPITIIGEDCEGAPVPVSGMPGEVTAVVQAPGTVFKVQLCNDPKDTEKVVLCDKNTDHKVAVISDLTDPAAPVVSYWDLNTGALWVGDVADLETCPGTSLESDPVEMCDSGVEFLRWIVKDNGEPTGEKFDTDLTGALYTVTDEASVKTGKCVGDVVCEPTISSAFGDDLGALLPGHSIAIQKPSCCAIKVLTSAGDFLVRKGMTAYSTADFNCPVTVTGVEIVSGTCEVSEIIVTTQNLG